MPSWQDPDNIASSRNAPLRSEYSDDSDDENKKKSFKIDLKDSSDRYKWDRYDSIHRRVTDVS